MSTLVDAERSALRLRRARLLTLIWLATTVFSGVLMPGVGVLRETRPLWAALGTLGIVVFAVAQAGLIYGSVTPERSRSASRTWTTAFIVASLASLVLVAPVAPGEWATWSWIGAAIIGTLPLVLSPARAAAAAVVVVIAGVMVAVAFEGSLLQSFVIVGAVGATLALVNWSPVWLWSLIVDAHGGREASAALAVTEERLRFARDVHDLLGHRLSIIALKAELVSRVVDDRPDEAARESSEIRRLAATALEDVRAAVSDSRQVDLARDFEALRLVLEASGVRCSVEAAAQVGPRIAAVLAPVAREAVTNVLRHSRATRCEISLRREDVIVVLTVVNNGVHGVVGGGDSASGGLLGIRERLREVGGRLEVTDDGREFVLRATIGAIG